MRAKYHRWTLSVSALAFVVSVTSCKQIPSELAASDKYRLVWNDNPTTTMTIIWDQLIGGQAVVLYGREDFGREYWRYPNEQTPTRRLNGEEPAKIPTTDG